MDFSSLTRCPGAGPVRRSSPRRRGSAAWSGSTPTRPRGATRAPRSTPRCSAWCAAWCRCPRCSRYAGATPRPDQPGAAGHLLPARASAATSCCRPSTAPAWPRSAPRWAGCWRTSAGCRCRARARSSTPTSRIGAVGARRLPGVRRRARAEPRPPLRRTSWRDCARSPLEAQDAARHRRGGPAWCTATSTPRTCSSTPTTLELTGGPGLGVRARRAPLHRPRQPAALRPRPGLRRRRAGGVRRPARNAPEDALALARAADLWALVDLAARRAANPVAARADRLLREIARRRDPHAAAR